MARKKILWFCSWYPDKFEPFNGDFVQRHARAAALYNDIYVIHVVGDDPGSAKKIHHTIEVSQGLTEHIVYFRIAKIFPKILNYYRWTSAYKKAVEIYLKGNPKPGLIHVHVPMRDGLMALKFKKKFDVPYIVTEHWTIYQPENKIKYEQQKNILRSIIALVVRNSQLLLPVSRDLGEKINRLVAKKDFTVVENVADVSMFNYKPLQGYAKVFRFIHVSNMSYQKNAEDLVDCFAAFQKDYPGSELVIVGPVPESILEKIESTRLLNKNIFLAGEVSYQEVAKQMQKANALVMFSRYENSPCSIIEALCCGLPVIATNVGGIPELITPENGILVETGDQQGLVLAMDKMKTSYNNFDRQKISENARARFSYSVIGKKLDEIYFDVIASWHY